MALPELDPVIHQATRLRIMALLHRNRDASFVWVRDSLGLTDGNLGGHVERLRHAGYVQASRALARSGFAVRIRTTPEGDDAFIRYARALQAHLHLEGPGGAASATEAEPRNAPRRTHASSSD